MERSDWDDDDFESPAPLPAHERVWRHPSEAGAEAWQRSEPPIALGRALTATTGAVGALLAGAIVLTLLPTHAGRTVVSARSVVSVLSTDDAEAEPAPATTQQGGSPDPVVASTTTPVGPAALLTPPTYHVADDTAPAVAVTIGELVVTTAAAALGRDTVDLVLADGSVDAALVLTVDHDRGLALLAPGHGTHVPSFDLAMAVRPGAELTIGDGSLGTAVLLDDGSVFTAAALDDTPEGTPLLDRRGDLVGLLTHGSAGARVVLVDVLDDLRWSLVHLHGRSGAQLGIGLSGRGAGALRISAIDADGPAAQAGLQVDDVIVAVNGVKVHRCDSLIVALAARRPGDTVVLTVRRGNEAVTATVVTD